METKNEHELEHGNHEDQSLATTLAQRQHTSLSDQNSHLSYFESDEPSAATHPIPTIPEGATVLTSVLPMSDTSPSPATTSGTTTTTPTSMGNTSPSGGDASGGVGKGATADYARENLPAHPSQQGVMPHQDSWAGGAASRAEIGHNHEDLYGQESAQQQSRYNPSNYPSALKLLVSNNVAGSIIGRGGQTISELQGQSSTRIKLSQTNDYYPGTQDRVCLIQGEPDHVKSALRLLLERLYMLQEHQHSPHIAWQQQRPKGSVPPTFDFVVRLLVPTSSCGMIIGKSGSNIKYLEETTGVSSVRLSPKESGEVSYPATAVISATSERIVTITGPSMESCLQCLHLIVDGMASHPDISRYSNMTTSYSRVVPDAYAPAVRPVLVSVPPPGATGRSTSEPLWENTQATFPSPGVLSRRTSSPDLPAIGLENRRSPGKEPQTPPERLTTYGAPAVPVTTQYSSPLPAAGAGTPTPGTGGGGGGGGGPLYLIPPSNDSGPADNLQHSASAPDLLSFQLEQTMHLTPVVPQQQPPPPPPQAAQQQGQDYSNTFVPQAPAMIAPGCFSAQALVPESMVGSILGRQGRTLTELQVLSGTRIRISQRGEYMPGTRSRIVTVRGATAQNVMQAQYMMSQRMVLPPTATTASTATGGPRIATTSTTTSSVQQQQHHHYHHHHQQSSDPPAAIEGNNAGGGGGGAGVSEQQQPTPL